MPVPIQIADQAECVLQWLGVVDRSGSLAPPATMVLDTADDEQVLGHTDSPSTKG